MSFCTYLTLFTFCGIWKTYALIKEGSTLQNCVYGGWGYRGLSPQRQAWLKPNNLTYNIRSSFNLAHRPLWHSLLGLQTGLYAWEFSTLRRDQLGKYCVQGLLYHCNNSSLREGLPTSQIGCPTPHTYPKHETHPTISSTQDSFPNDQTPSVILTDSPHDFTVSASVLFVVYELFPGTCVAAVITCAWGWGCKKPGEALLRGAGCSPREEQAFSGGCVGEDTSVFTITSH